MYDVVRVSTNLLEESRDLIETDQANVCIVLGRNYWYDGILTFDKKKFELKIIEKLSAPTRVVS